MADNATPEPIPFPTPKGKQRNPNAAEDAKLGGCPPGAQHKDKGVIKTTAQERAAVEQAALAVISGRNPIRRRGPLQPLPESEIKRLERFAGMSAEEFSARVTERLRTLADLTSEQIHQHLVAENYKPHELSFLLTVLVDKIARIEGRSAVTSASVNVQINNNNFVGSKEELIARLTGQAPVNVTPPPAPAVADEPAQAGDEDQADA